MLIYGRTYTILKIPVFGREESGYSVHRQFVRVSEDIHGLVLVGLGHLGSTGEYCQFGKSYYTGSTVATFPEKVGVREPCGLSEGEYFWVQGRYDNESLSPSAQF